MVTTVVMVKVLIRVITSVIERCAPEKNKSGINGSDGPMTKIANNTKGVTFVF